MRIVHVGSGFRPWRRGGLVAYVEDLMQAQADQGHEVNYFFSGRQYPLGDRPRIRRWARGAVAMYEVINSPLFDHGRQPTLELEEPGIEALFAGLVSQLRPDVIHIQELAGLPSSLLDVAHRSAAATVFTLQDYFPLCSTFKLLDADGRVCMRREIGFDCAATVAGESRAPGLLIEATVNHDLMAAPFLRRLAPERRQALTRRTGTLLGTIEARRRTAGRRQAPAPQSFQRRREVNLDRLSQLDCLIAMSQRLADIYCHLGVDARRLRTMQLTLAHLDRLKPRRRSAGVVPSVPTFASLAAFETTAKGGHLLLEAVRRLTQTGLGGQFRVLIFGYVDPRLAAQAAHLAQLEIRGPFTPGDLDEILEEVDVGIMPSIWEEAYGYAGIEFLAKGIPVIANARGGMPEYVRPGQTGWLNQSCSAAELTAIMADVVENPAQVNELSELIIELRPSLVKPIDIHAEETAEIYRELRRNYR